VFYVSVASVVNSSVVRRIEMTRRRWIFASAAAAFLGLCAWIYYFYFTSGSAGPVVQAPPDAPKHFVNSIGMKMVLIPAGSFLMGSDAPPPHMPPTVKGNWSPSHRVSLSAFYASAFEITKGQYRKFVSETGQGNIPLELADRPDSLVPGDDLAIEKVDWFSANQFCEWLSQKEGLTYRLPTEAEWEYLCKAATESKYWWGDEFNGCILFYYASGPYSDMRPVPISGGTYPANPWGLYEVLGNVSEWTQDWASESYYSWSEEINPLGPRSGNGKIVRGGFYRTPEELIGCANRFSDAPTSLISGFRPICEITPSFRVPPEWVPVLRKPLPLPDPPPSAGPRLTVELKPGVSMAFAWIPPGEGVMGSPESERWRSNREGPQARLHSSGYHLGAHEVTQAQFEAVMGSNPSAFLGPDLPVEQMTHDEAVEFCKKLTERERAAGRLPEGAVFRLPFEAEWEYACRAGTSTAFSFGGSPDDLELYAVFDTTEGPKPVGGRPPNAWGLHDMHGNVWEWCMDDTWDYKGKEVRLPFSRNTGGVIRLARGGGWNFAGHRCRSAARYGLHRTTRYNFAGFRVLRTPGVQ
jgi:formylglycine-generating enzyme required for sulfatase activity